ncbi:unnamed protein product [Durusdinium trenchii]|uniref:Uncharacterized protein n=1 Tax=Durusdinium trenchii TaxID=1381693 RepID=A0ABP0LQ72_9DINO
MPGTFYRWSEDQTRALLNCLDMQKLLKKRRKPADGGAEEVDVLDGLMAEVLEELKIPDAYGCWRPRSTKRHIMTGDRPTAPLPIRGTTATLTKAVWVRQLQKDDNGGFKFVSNAFQIDPAPSNIVHLTYFHPSHIIAIPLFVLATFNTLPQRPAADKPNC